MSDETHFCITDCSILGCRTERIVLRFGAIAAFVYEIAYMWFGHDLFLRLARIDLAKEKKEKKSEVGGNSSCYQFGIPSAVLVINF